MIQQHQLQLQMKLLEGDKVKKKKKFWKGISNFLAVG